MIAVTYFGGKEIAMSFTVACPTCSESLQVDSRVGGQPISCPHCNLKFMCPPAPAQRPKPNPKAKVRPNPAPLRTSPSSQQSAPTQPEPEPQVTSESKEFKFFFYPNVFGQVSSAFGLLLLLFYWLGYDTSYMDVKNVGLMNNQLVGVIVGSAFLIFGAIPRWGRVRPRRPPKKKTSIPKMRQVIRDQD
jgi:hypothetical protein